VVKKTEVKTTSLFLRYNKITVLDGLPEILQQILPNKWQQLVWIDLSHNRLTKISLHLQALPQLKNLYLHVNFISSFK
jgi:Leucine-rich repeat (LRR) protein